MYIIGKITTKTKNYYYNNNSYYFTLPYIHNNNTFYFTLLLLPTLTPQHNHPCRIHTRQCCILNSVFVECSFWDCWSWHDHKWNHCRRTSNFPTKHLDNQIRIVLYTFLPRHSGLVGYRSHRVGFLPILNNASAAYIFVKKYFPLTSKISR